MTDPLEHILRLAFEIGRRPATGEGERRAAAYIRDQLEKFGFSAKTEPVRAARSTSPSLVVILLLSLVGAISYVVAQLTPSDLINAEDALTNMLLEPPTTTENA